MIERKHGKISVRRQSDLLSLNRSRLYYNKRSTTVDSIAIARKIAALHHKVPFYGYRRMRVALEENGCRINTKKIRRMKKEMGLYTVYPKKKVSISGQVHKRFPYLLSDMAITKPNYAWSVDITYIKLNKGFVYVAAIIDLFSRKIMGWYLSPFLDTSLCLEALNMALQHGIPEIINSDQGCQFTSASWIETLSERGIQISMDGKGRWADNIWIERFWRSLKYENVLLQSFETVRGAQQAIAEYINFYNNDRVHQALGYKTPQFIYQQRICNNPTKEAPWINQQGSTLKRLQPTLS